MAAMRLRSTKAKLRATSSGSKRQRQPLTKRATPKKSKPKKSTPKRAPTPLKRKS